ncbi:hypothetical protein ABKW28_05000 [Nocardioides sp. 31GB23]|uniref:hypothetical protein n=1 Tax=Nocardioides sp. 31GB23 TaxID=3156065 RepID=UPI0032AEFCE9
MLDEVTRALDEHLPGWKLRQVKSDLAMLDMYVDLPGGASPSEQAAVRAAQRTAAQHSVATCEVCGASGLVRTTGTWRSVLCDKHQAVPAVDVPLVELRVDAICRLCGHLESRHEPNSRLPLSPRTCRLPAGMGAECICPLIETLALDAHGDFEVLTASGTRYYLRLGGPDPRWFRSPGPTSSGEYAGRWNRLGSLRGRSRGSRESCDLQVGNLFTVGIGSFTDVMHASRIVWMRRVTDPADLPPRVEYCRTCNQQPVAPGQDECVDCLED